MGLVVAFLVACGAVPTVLHLHSGDPLPPSADSRVTLFYDGNFQSVQLKDVGIMFATVIGITDPVEIQAFVNKQLGIRPAISLADITTASLDPRLISDLDRDGRVDARDAGILLAILVLQNRDPVQINQFVNDILPLDPPLSLTAIDAARLPGPGFVAVPSVPMTDREIVVNSVVDEADGDPFDGVCATAEGSCTLRAAIQTANRFDEGVTGILIPPGTYQLTLLGNDFQAAVGDLNISRSMVLKGSQAESTIIDGRLINNGIISVFPSFEGPDIDLTLQNITLQNGQREEEAGGALSAQIRSLTILDCIIRNNQADFGGGVFASQGNIPGSAEIRVFNTLFENNRARNGGSISVFNFSEDPEDSTLVRIQASEFRGNQAESGGAIQQGTNIEMEISNSVFSDNEAEFSGGGILSFSNLTITQSQFLRNQAGRVGGAISSRHNLALTDTQWIGNVSFDGFGGAIRHNKLSDDQQDITLNIKRGEFVDNWAIVQNQFTLGGAISLTDSILTSTGIPRFGNATVNGIQFLNNRGNNIIQFPEPPQTFSPAGSFSIEIEFIDNTLNTAQRNSVINAANRWAEIISQELGPVNLILPAGACGDLIGFPPTAINRTVRNILIQVTGAGLLTSVNAAGEGGPCGGFRSVSGLPIYGRVAINPQVVESAQESLFRLALHEMGHVLGIGTVWRQTQRSLIANPMSGDPRFVGSQGVAQYNAVGGVGAVPVQLGSLGHWREGVLFEDFMNPNSGSIITPVTAAALADLGYTVTFDNIEPYFLPGSPADFPPPFGQNLRQGSPTLVEDPVDEGPVMGPILYFVDPDGNYTSPTGETLDPEQIMQMGS